MENDVIVKEGLRRINRTVATFSRNFDYPGYTFNEMNILGTIVRNPGIIARDICEHNVIDRGYLSRLLKRLEQNGLILRTAERRPPFEKILSATPLGEKIYSEVELLVDQTIAERISVLNESERKAFYDCAGELLRYLKKIEPDTPKGNADEGNSYRDI